MPRAPHPRLLRSLLGLPVASPRGQQTAANARHTFYLPKPGRKFEPFSLLNGRASGRQKVGLQGRLGMDSRDARGEEKPSLKRNITGEGRPLAAVSDPALGGFASAPDTAGQIGRAQAEGRPLVAVSDPALGGSTSTGHSRPPTIEWPLSRSLSSGQHSNRCASTGPARLSMPSQCPVAAWGNTFPARRTGWLAGWQWGRCP